MNGTSTKRRVESLNNHQVTNRLLKGLLKGGGYIHLVTNPLQN